MKLLQASAPDYDSGLARGRWQAPAWVVAGLGALVALAAIGFVLGRAMRSRREAPRASIPPRSRRR